MALSCVGLCSQLSLARFFGLLRTNTPGVYTHCTSSQFGLVSRFPPCRSYSSSTARRSIARHVSSKLKWATAKYESFLKRRFPRFYQLHQTFMEGSRLLFKDAKDMKRIKAGMYTERIKVQDLPYRDMEKLRQVRRDIIKAIPLVLIAIPPFANYLVFVLMYFFPRQLLIRHFWTLKQLTEFSVVYHSLRAQHHLAVLKGLENISFQVKDGHLQSRLKELSTKVQYGAHPEVSEIHSVRDLFSGPPLGMKNMNVEQMRHMCSLLFLTPRLPGFMINRRLNSHGLELLQLDRALGRLGPNQLTDSELRQACYVRGLDSYSLSINQCRDWLSQWLQVSSALKESEVSLLLHSMVLLSVNYAHSHNHH